MIGQYLSNKNESATVAKSEIFNRTKQGPVKTQLYVAALDALPKGNQKKKRSPHTHTHDRTHVVAPAESLKSKQQCRALASNGDRRHRRALRSDGSLPTQRRDPMPAGAHAAMERRVREHSKHMARRTGKQKYSYYSVVCCGRMCHDRLLMVMAWLALRSCMKPPKKILA